MELWARHTPRGQRHKPLPRLNSRLGQNGHPMEHPSTNAAIECTCGRWTADPAVVAAREAAQRARAEWNATRLPFGVTGQLNAQQRALRLRVDATDQEPVEARDLELSSPRPWTIAAKP